MYKVLLDENLPVRIKYRLQDACEIYTVSDKGWNALENGDLIEAMEQNSFDYLVTSIKIYSIKEPYQIFYRAYCIKCYR